MTTVLEESELPLQLQKLRLELVAPCRPFSETHVALALELLIRRSGFAKLPLRLLKLLLELAVGHLDLIILSLLVIL